MLAIILHVTSAAAGAAGWPPDSMVPRLGGNDLALDGGQHLLRLGQAQAQIGDVAKVIRLRDLHHVGAPIIATSARFHQPQNPGHPRHPRERIAPQVIAYPF